MILQVTLENTLTRTSIKTLALKLKKLIKAGNTGGTIPQNAIIWQTTTMPGITISNPLTLANGVLYQASWTGYVRALNATTGAELWRAYPIPVASPTFPLPAFLSGGVTVANGKIYVGLGFEQFGFSIDGGGIVAYDLPKHH